MKVRITSFPDGQDWKIAEIVRTFSSVSLLDIWEMMTGVTKIVARQLTADQAQQLVTDLQGAGCVAEVIDDG